MNIKKSISELSYFERMLWISSVTIIIIFSLFIGIDYIISPTASVIGATALIFLSKGNVLGQILIVIFSILYGIISYSFHYYGEMITYLCVTAPIAILAVISWLRHPYNGNTREVEVNRISKSEMIIIFIVSLIVTFIFYFILNAFNTSSLILSTLSVTTSFLASYLTFRRSEFYALAYAANDIVLIILWIIATVSDYKYLSMTICFCIFFINDIYGFISWRKIKNRQIKCS